MKTWIKLQNHDMACVIAPSYHSCIKHQDVEEIVKQNMLTPYLYPDIDVPGNHSIYDAYMRLANTDEMRARHFIDAMNNQSCKVVWANTGGYGTIRLIKYIKDAPEPKEIKPLLGFSDITLLHLFLQEKWGWPSIHYGMPGARGLNQTVTSGAAITDITDIPFASVSTVSFSLHPLLPTTKKEDIIGVTSGGNILTFSRSFGTEIQPDLAGKILVFEEVGENKRKIDGMLSQLQLLSNFDKVSAVVFGTLDAVPDELIEGHHAFSKILKDFASNSGVPVFQLEENDTIGHGHTVNRALPMGTEATISCVEMQCQMVVKTGYRIII